MCPGHTMCIQSQISPGHTYNVPGPCMFITVVHVVVNPPKPFNQEVTVQHMSNIRETHIWHRRRHLVAVQIWYMYRRLTADLLRYTVVLVQHEHYAKIRNIWQPLCLIRLELKLALPTSTCVSMCACVCVHVCILVTC